jgi:phosphate starvation-inducible PhoH-like protein
MNTPALQFAFEPVDNKRLAYLCGPFDENLRQVETALEVGIARHGEHFSVQGAQAELARQVLQDFYLEATHDITLERLQLALIEAMKWRDQPQPASDSVPLLMMPKSEIRGRASDTLLTKSADCGRRRDAATPAPVGFTAPCRGRTPRQNNYIQAIQEHDITFGVGPAGTGKTYLAVACAVDALQREAVRRLVLVRPAVEAGEKLGFLPGDLAQKVDPYLRPLYDALYDLMGAEKVARAFERGVIEIAPLAYMRGRTLNHSFIILDEAQNTTPEQMKMFLTRIGFGSKAVITGDVTQIDLVRGQKSGLIESRNVLKDVHGIVFSDFLAEDVVRHPLVQKIVTAYERYEQQKSP